MIELSDNTLKQPAPNKDQPWLNQPDPSVMVQGRAKAWQDFWVLFLEHLISVKASIIYFFFMQTIGPIALIFAMGHYSGYIPESNQLTRIVAGAVTFALVTVGLTSVAQKLCWMRLQGTLVYYSSLPINKVTFVLALLFSRIIILLPSIVTPIVASVLMYNLKLDINLWLPVVLVSGALSLVALGTTLGVLISSYEIVSLVSNAFIIVMAFASPTFIDAKLLPLPLQWLGWILPSTYISDALTHCLLGNFDVRFSLDLLFLGVSGLVAIFLTIRFVRWEKFSS